MKSLVLLLLSQQLTRAFGQQEGVCGCGTLDAAPATQPYVVRPLKLGVEVFGIDLSEKQPREVIEQIKSDVTRHRLVIFREQHSITPTRHLQIGEWFGPIDWMPYYDDHPRPARGILRMSNDPKRGYLFKNHAWHCDCTYHARPCAHGLLRIVNVSESGSTRFVGSRELLQSLPIDQYARWNRLWTLRDRDRAGLHPLIWKHPLTKTETIAIHNAMVAKVYENLGQPTERVFSDAEKLAFRKEFRQTIDNSSVVYYHKYRKGDFIITDNLALLHGPDRRALIAPEKMGLRVLDRVLTSGTVRPAK